MSIQSEINRISANVQNTLAVIASTGVEVGTNSDDLEGAATALANTKQDKIGVASVTLSTTWAGEGPFTQTVAIAGVTANSKVDLQPAAEHLAQLIADGVSALMIVNDGGTCTAYAVGAAPTVEMTLQCTIIEITGG